ncbi:MAG: LysR family transcriptional regulator [Rhodobacteraceae bacterium]|nr:LysR family transcriptional regulator [Paracoccaceae bacterium]
MTLRFTLRQLEYFVAVGECGSIAGASDKVNVTAPTISAALSQLQKEMGLPLFVRKHAQGLSLTQSGRQFLVQAKQVLSEAQALNRLAGDISGSVQGPLNVACLLTFAQLLVPALRRGFSQRYPDVQLRQFELNQMEIFEQLRRGEVDVALTYDMHLPQDLEFVPLRTLPTYAVLSQNHPLAKKTVVSVEELAEHPMILLDLPISSEYFMSFFRLTGHRPNIVERTKDMEVLRALVANDFGYSIVNIRPRNDLSPDGQKLRFIPLNGPVIAMEIGLVMVREARNAAVIEAFSRHCRKTMDEWDFPGQALSPAS